MILSATGQEDTDSDDDVAQCRSTTFDDVADAGYIANSTQPSNVTSHIPEHDTTLAADFSAEPNVDRTIVIIVACGAATLVAVVLAIRCAAAWRKAARGICLSACCNRSNEATSNIEASMTNRHRSTIAEGDNGAGGNGGPAGGSNPAFEPPSYSEVCPPIANAESLPTYDEACHLPPPGS